MSILRATPDRLSPAPSLPSRLLPIFEDFADCTHIVRQSAARLDDRQLSAVALEMAVLLGELHDAIEDATPDDIEVGA